MPYKEQNKNSLFLIARKVWRWWKTAVTFFQKKKTREENLDCEEGPAQRGLLGTLSENGCRDYLVVETGSPEHFSRDWV